MLAPCGNVATLGHGEACREGHLCDPCAEVQRLRAEVSRLTVENRRLAAELERVRIEWVPGWYDIEP